MPYTVPACPQCGLENTYPDSSNYVCPDCAFEWPQVADAAEADADAGDGIVRDANGNPLADGDADRKSTRLNSSHLKLSRMPSSA